MKSIQSITNVYKPIGGHKSVLINKEMTNTQADGLRDSTGSLLWVPDHSQPNHRL